MPHNPQTEIYSPEWIPSASYGGANRGTWARHVRELHKRAATNDRWQQARDYLDVWDVFGDATYQPYAGEGAGHDPRTPRDPLATRADAHQRARILREATNRIPLPLARTMGTAAQLSFTAALFAAEDAATRQEAIGNGINPYALRAPRARDIAGRPSFLVTP